MSIEFDNAEGRQKYLTAKLDDLLDGINESYGKVLLDELISRLEKTISDFNDEVQGLMDQLKKNTEKKEKLLKDIIASEGKPSDVTAEPVHDEESQREISEWERRLESLVTNR